MPNVHLIKGAYIIASSSVSSGKGHYRRLAIIELIEPNGNFKTISKHDKGIKRIVETWEHLHYGGPKSQFGHALNDAIKQLENLP